jgi:hypothetical protein
MSVENEDAFEKAMNELDELEKSVKEPETEMEKAMEEPMDELDELTKALEEELGENLSKACNEKEEEKEEKEDGDKDDEGAEPEELGKSQEDNYDEELVKASEAFSSLEKSVSELGFGFASEINALKKSIAALLNLNIKQAKVVASLSKAQQDHTERITKSMGDFGSKPMAPGLAAFGTGGMQPEILEKSISEISDALLKAVQAKQVDSRHLSIFGTYKDVNRLPADVKKIIGL